MTATERMPLPNWPIRLSEDFAAQFVGVSKTTFRQKWQNGSYPRPLREGKRLFWHRTQLERFVDGQFGLGQPSASAAEGDDTWDDYN